MKMLTAFIAAALSVTPAMAHMNSFNLNCQLRYSMLAGKLINDGPLAEPHQYIYRIDLAAGRYCSQDCIKTEALDSVTDSTITLWRLQGESFSSTERINRESGEYLNSTFADGRLESVKFGTCIAEPFSGFPQRKF